jgi:hypothetical protein
MTLNFGVRYDLREDFGDVTKPPISILPLPNMKVSSSHSCLTPSGQPHLGLYFLLFSESIQFIIIFSNLSSVTSRI